MEIRILENISTIPNYDISNIKNYFDGGKVPAKYFQCLEKLLRSELKR